MTRWQGGFSRRSVLKTLLATTAFAGVGRPVARAAEKFPAKPVTIIVPYGAGGTVDIYFRELGKLAARHLGQPIVIENKPGAGGAMGAIGLAALPKSDGYVLTVATEGLLRLPYLEQVAYDLDRDFTYVIGLAAFNFGIAVRKDSPFKTLKDVLDAARARPGQLKYSAGLANTTMPLMMVKVERDTGARMLHVPFRSGTEMLTALLGGHVDMMLDSTGGMVSQIDSGGIRLLATFGESRSPKWPSVPTAKELGVDAIGVLYFGLVAAKGLEPQIVGVLHDAFRKATTEPEYEALRRNSDVLHWVKAPEEFRDIFLKTYRNYGDILQQAGMRKY